MTPEKPWWPSPFGAGDELGMLNHIDDAKRRAATALIREGRLYDLSQVLDEKSPTFPGRYFRQTLVTTAHHANAGLPLGEAQSNAIPFRKGNPKFKAAIDQALADIQADGTFANISHKWFGRDVSKPLAAVAAK